MRQLKDILLLLKKDRQLIHKAGNRLESNQSLVVRTQCAVV